MIETELALLTPVLDSQAGELERRLFFVSPLIESFELITRDGVVGSVRLKTKGAIDGDQLAAKIDSLVRSDLVPQPEISAKVVWQSAQRARNLHDAFGDLAVVGRVGECGEGQMVVGEPLIALMDGLDRRVRDIARDAFGAVEFRYPTLLSTRILESTGYPSSFPQFLMLVTRLHEDLDVYRAFQHRYAANPVLDSGYLAECRNVDYCLPPAPCYHTFGRLRGCRLNTEGLQVETLRAKTFRHESRYAATLERLWDFTVRETVFLGERGAVLDARQKHLELICALVDELELDGYCEPASDPFFIGSDPAARSWSQRLLELKYELRLRIRPDHTLAVGSFNFHDDFFGAGFGITRPAGDRAVSGCTGIGLERLAYAVLCQHGVEPSGWPASVRALCADR